MVVREIDGDPARYMRAAGNDGDLVELTGEKKKEGVMRMSRKSRAFDLQVARRMNSKSGKQERAPPPGPNPGGPWRRRRKQTRKKEPAGRQNPPTHQRHRRSHNSSWQQRRSRTSTNNQRRAALWCILSQSLDPPSPGQAR